MLAVPIRAHRIYFIGARENIMRELLLAAAITAAAALGPCTAGFAQEDTDRKLGTVHFATSCNETAQRRFDRAMRYQHSFWYSESTVVHWAEVTLGL